ncbi:ATP-dependent DNA helicase pfh1, partial [Toxocara canis]
DAEGKLELRRLVLAHMIHRPCHKGNFPCRSKEGFCTKRFPKAFQEDTAVEGSGYALLRRPNDGTLALLGDGKTVVSNRDVVPYSTFFLKKYRTHTNVEHCASVECIKYIFKYVFKGYDCAVMQLMTKRIGEGVTEEVEIRVVSWVRRMRVVTAPEACYRDCGYRMHRISHAIVRLNIHLPGEKNVYFVEGEVAQALRKSTTRCSQLEGFFELNNKDSAARQYTFLEIPKRYRWDEKKGAWVRRVRMDKILTRMYTVKARFVEKFSLRMLLKYVKGPRSFEDVRTVAGHIYPSFFEACVAFGLSVVEKVWEESLREVCAYNMPRQARQSFAAMISFGAIFDAPRLWDLFKGEMMDRDARRTPEQKQYAALRHIQRILKAVGQDLNAYGIPFEERAQEIESDLAHMDDVEGFEERHVVERMYEELNVGQRTAVDRVLHAVQDSTAASGAHRCFFLQGAGGTGKTYLYNLIIRILRLRSSATIAVAFTGIAATLLIGGTAVHSRFRLPLHLYNDSVSTMKANSEEANAIRNCPLIVWDEACTQKRYALEAVERLLRDIAVGELKTAPFGGHVILLGGDWRQMLPIVEDGTNEDTIGATIRISRLWSLFEVINLNENMRTGPGEQVFGSFLERLGNGELQDKE